MWGKFPINQVIRARWWRVPYDEVPRSADDEAQLQWLYDWWERIDTWISDNRPGVRRCRRRRRLQKTKPPNRSGITGIDGLRDGSVRSLSGLVRVPFPQHERGAFGHTQGRVQAVRR